MRFASGLITALAVASIAPLMFAPAVRAAEPVMLNPHVVLNKDVLTVGDLFDAAGPSADHVLAMAPAAGTDLTLTRAELQKVADNFHLDWHSDDPALTAIVERNALLVTPSMLTEALAASSLADKLEPDAEITLKSPAKGIIVTGQDTPVITFDEIAYDTPNQTFTATALLSLPGQPAIRAMVSGVAAAMIDVPVLTSAVARGAVISRADITTLRLPVKDVKAMIASHVDDVAGMVARRNLDAQKLLVKNDLVPPMLIRRNEIVTVIYRNGSMSLTTKARALSNGAKGETVQLENPSSKKLIEATVTGPQQTTISMDNALPANG